MKNSRFIVLLVFSASLFYFLILSGCKKYPEGGNSSFAPGKVMGEYFIEYYTVNYADSLLYLLDSLLPTCENYFKFDQKKVGRRGDPYVLRLKCDSLFTDAESTVWDFPANEKKTRKDKRKLYLYIRLWNENNTIFYRYLWYWDILKLTDTELWLTRSENGKQYELHFKQF